MNYRHAFHAGNFADVFKHILLTRILLHLGRKATPFRYIDTHAGVGLYNLQGDEARRSGEWPRGIGRITPGNVPADVLPLIEPYLDLVGPRDGTGCPTLYPGSPSIALGIARPQDRLIFCELHPTDAASLRKGLGRANRAKVVEIDGYVALNAYVPPQERRGLVLIDPPFEERGEFEAMLDGLVAAHRKWPTGIYALWYPLKDRTAVSRFANQLIASGIPRIAQVELVIDWTALDVGKLAGCGMILVNPPFGLEDEARLLLPYLAKTLTQSEPGSWQWRWLAGE
ncbi:23S rRNA (adenine(2030)-N(6))-methyltransferase RlmJ [Lichenihabitans psoromatis]|uniref:23S rRNA (adenine(2030)-N(6))-methyltransferase RlmJ n=1 Tax=Lichenihabitans psoromatis TaxID=2528642 RepID=UPI0010384C73|nr:23S rRNA (adenine(2030)-N(6))-methyltransferase RlmJ [Lichenihabitans psoromatis]